MYFRILLSFQINNDVTNITQMCTDNLHLYQNLSNFNSTEFCICWLNQYLPLHLAIKTVNCKLEIRVCSTSGDSQVLVSISRNKKSHVPKWEPVHTSLNKMSTKQRQ